MQVHFTYEKKKVLQALRYHFLSRREIRLMIVAINVFALASAALFYFKKILPHAFLFGSSLWFLLMIAFWFLLPGLVYRRNATFRDHFTMDMGPDHFTIGNERGSRQWAWRSVSKFLETPYFFHLYFDNRSFFLVPKDGLSRDETFDMRQLLKEKIGGA